MNYTLTIVIDTREIAPFAFAPHVTVVRRALPAGDYSIDGYEHITAIERKSHDDAWASVYTAAARRRLARVLDVMAGYVAAGGFAAIAIACTRQQLMAAPFVSGMDDRAGRRIVGHWEAAAGARSIPIMWGATAAAVEDALRAWVVAFEQRIPVENRKYTA